MIEAVGQNYLEGYFKTIKTNLSDGGKAAIQAITIDDRLFDRYKNKQDFIQKYIFPGGFLPSKNSLNKHVSENGLTIKSYDSYACLLYTSPSPRDATLSRMPSSA